MPLRTFISELEQQSDLQRIAAAVSPELELAAITDRICKAPNGGKALLFEQVTGFRFPVATNLFGSLPRICRALNVPSLEHFGRRLRDALQGVAGRSAADRLQLLLADDTLRPVSAERPACRQVSAAPDLSLIPALRCWPRETRPGLTLPLVFTADPETGEQNCGMYRVQFHGPDRATVNFGAASGGAGHWRNWQQRKQPMPVAIALGGDPALIWAAGAPLPKSCDELRMAAWVSGRAQAVSAGLGQPLRIPATAEFIIEGIIRPGETGAEGPFGNHTGSYVSNPAAALFRVTAISHRSDALCPATLVGPPPMEDCYLAKAGERLLLAMLMIDYPQIRELHLPLESIFHGCALLAVEGLRAGQGRELLRALWHDGPLQKAKLLILLDSDVDLGNPSLSYWRVVNRLAADRILTDRGRIGIDATGVDPAALVGADRKTAERVTRRWPEYGLD